MYNEIILGLVSLFTSTIAGIMGVGGGLLLIAIMPLFLSAGLIIPLHSVTQIASNGSRAVLAIRSVEWRLFPGFLLGSMLGVLCFGILFVNLPSRFLPLGIGSYILLSLWSSKFDRLVGRYETFFSAGFFQTGLGLMVGATGPLTTSLMVKKLANKDEIVATNAFFMMFTHLFKIIFIAAIGFEYLQHYFLIAMLILGAVAGSWLGTHIRARIDSRRFKVWLKWLLSVLAFQMMAGVLWPFLS